MADTDKEEKNIEGLGITKTELRQFLKSKLQEEGGHPLVTKELYARDDGDYTLVTENHPRMLPNKIRLRVLLAAMDPNRTKPLIQVFLEAYNEEMISFKRQGRQEYLGALQALSAQDMEERPVSLR